MRWNLVVPCALALLAADAAPSLVGVAHAETIAQEACGREGGSRELSSGEGALRVGDQLQATHDVELDEATIAEGSKISVSALKRASGQVLLDVALADGHVVRNVPLTKIAKSFRRIEA